MAIRPNITNIIASIAVLFHIFIIYYEQVLFSIFAWLSIFETFCPSWFEFIIFCLQLFKKHSKKHFVDCIYLIKIILLLLRVHAWLFVKVKAKVAKAEMCKLQFIAPKFSAQVESCLSRIPSFAFFCLCAVCVSYDIIYVANDIVPFSYLIPCLFFLAPCSVIRALILEKIYVINSPT